MMTLQNQYWLSPEQGFSITGSSWWALMFTPDIDYKVELVNLLLYRGKYTGLGTSGDNPGTLIVSIRPWLYGPSGETLCSGQLAGMGVHWDGSVPAYGGTGAEYEVSLGDGAILSAGTAYVLQVGLIPSNENVCIYWLVDLAPFADSPGWTYNSTNGGSSWNTWLNAAPLYQLWGTAIVPEPPAPPVSPLPDFPAPRPDLYEPDDFWLPGEWDGDVYTPPAWGQPGDSKYFATGGGRWGQQLVAVGHGVIYYEELT